MLRIARHLLAGIAVLGLCAQAQAQTTTRTTETQSGPVEVRKTIELGKGVVEEVLRVEGGRAVEVSGADAGYAFAAFPGVKRITRSALSSMRDIPKTGLFIVDADYVPVTLMEDLKADGYELREDGALVDAEGELATMFVRPETFKVMQTSIGPDQRFFQEPSPPSQPDDRGGIGKQGSLSPMPDMLEQPIWSRLEDLLNGIGDTLISPAHAASPFPFTCFSWYWRWKYNGGFCRDYRAWTDAYSWGPGPGGGCSGPLPHTNITYIRAYARAAGDVDDKYCYNCDQRHASAKYKIGCFWPAHGNGSGYHFIHMVDGTIQVVRSHSWAH